MEKYGVNSIIAGHNKFQHGYVFCTLTNVYDNESVDAEVSFKWAAYLHPFASLWRFRNANTITIFQVIGYLCTHAISFIAIIGDWSEIVDASLHIWRDTTDQSL